jgi:hypothetical protein
VADKDRRDVERKAATGDPEAEAKLRRERCRSGQCCAHSEDNPFSRVEGSHFFSNNAVSHDFKTAHVQLTFSLHGKLEDVMWAARFLRETLKIKDDPEGRTIQGVVPYGGFQPPAPPGYQPLPPPPLGGTTPTEEDLPF